LAQSINIPAIKVLYLAGIRDSINLARNLGIESLDDPSRYGLTLVLGGGEVSLLEMTGAYSVFANDGVRNPHEKILRVENNRGEVVEEFSARPRQVLSANVARMISSVLSDNQARQPSYSANSPLYFPNYQVAAKTGTTNDYKDAWILGYTPTLAAGAWVGNNDNTPMEKKVAGLIVAPLWRAFMDRALAKVPTESFPAPEPVSSELPPVYRGFWQGNRNYYIDKSSGKLATEYTPEELVEEKVVREVHSILYWLGRTNDSQFRLWEEPIRAWALSQGYADEPSSVIPSERDDTHLPSSRPRFNIKSPSESQTYEPNDKISVSISGYTGRYPLKQIDVFLNDDFLGSVKNEPYEFVFVPEEASSLNSTNELRVIAHDSAGNKREETIKLIVRASS
jgi:membrane peptidoglycan carboxypeptidase